MQPNDPNPLLTERICNISREAFEAGYAAARTEHDRRYADTIQRLKDELATHKKRADVLLQQLDSRANSIERRPMSINIVLTPPQQEPLRRDGIGSSYDMTVCAAVDGSHVLVYDRSGVERDVKVAVRWQR
jgi:hypothetical protein